MCLGCRGRGAGVQVCALEWLAESSLVPWAAQFTDELGVLSGNVTVNGKCSEVGKMSGLPPTGLLGLGPGKLKGWLGPGVAEIEDSDLGTVFAQTWCRW